MRDERRFHLELIRRAKAGDAEAGREILQSIVHCIDAGKTDGPLFHFLAENLWLFLSDRIPLERALCVEESGAGGRPPTYDMMEVLAVDALLRRCRFSKEDAIAWIQENIGADRTTVQRYRRAATDSFYGQSDDDLLHMAGSHRQKVADTIGQNPA